jgi:chaperonin GroES
MRAEGGAGGGGEAVSAASDDIRRGNAPRRGAFKGLQLNPKALRPTGDNVLVEREKPDTQQGLIVIPDAHKERKITGRALAVGPHCQEVKVGDRVMIAKYGSVDLVVNSGGTAHEVMVVSESGICLVIGDDVELEEAPL